MIPELVVKYFFYNRKRTYVAVFVLGCSLSLIISTNMVLSGYEQRVSQITQSSLGFKSSADLVITPTENKYFTEEELDTLNDRLSNFPEVEYFIKSSIFPVYLNFNNHSTLTDGRISDLESMNDKTWIASNSSSPIIVYKDFEEKELIESINIPHLNSTWNFTYQPEYDFEKVIQFSSDILFDSELFSNYDQIINAIEIEVVQNVNTDSLISKINRFQNFEIHSTRGDVQFIEISVSQIIKILELLQLLLSILLILSIGYIMVSIINDSREDIRIMNTIGMSKFSQFLIFQFQSILISIFSFLFGFISSIIGLSLIFSLIAAIGIFPYFTLDINNYYQLSVLIDTIVIGILAGFVPSLKVVLE